MDFREELIALIDEDKSITQLLIRWRSGDGSALGELTPLVYDQLRRLADRYMRGEHAGHTLQATALVHEAYVRMVDMEVSWEDRAHFFALSARMMRRILVDHAKTLRRAKRGGGAIKVSLDESLLVDSDSVSGLVDLDDALTGLAAFDERKARIVELQYFGGLTYDETAEALGVSAATVDRELRLAKAWLYRELSPEAGAD